MAIDRAIQIAVSEGSAPPTLRIYRWERPTVTLGRFQSLEDVDREACREYGIDLARRHTGGRGVLHDDEVTYSIVARTSDGVPRGTAASYRFLSAGLVETYRALGVPAEFLERDAVSTDAAACYLISTRADLVAKGRKLSGSAQVWSRETVLQHGSVQRTRDVRMESRVFRLGAEGERELEQHASTLSDFLEPLPDVDTLAEALVEGFEVGLHVTLVDAECPSEGEIDTARALSAASDTPTLPSG